MIECFDINKPFGNSIFLIAEIGINHNGDLKIAKELIFKAKSAGFDAVKFQKRNIDTVYREEVLSQFRESPFGTTQRDQKEGLEFSKSDYDEIDKYCTEVGILWSASAWDNFSQEFLSSYKLSFNKVASAMATNQEFLNLVAEENKPTFVSTGMCTMEQIKYIVDIFQSKNCPLVLMHTNSEYPSPEENLNLSMINTLKNEFRVPIGYSGHEVSVSPSYAAVALGAVAVERHITLDRSMYGSDQSASLEPIAFERLVSMIRKFEQIIGDGVKKITEGEKEVAKKLRYWNE
jgi:N-acetylneuraminate synthase